MGAHESANHPAACVETERDPWPRAQNNGDDPGQFRADEVETDEASYLPLKMVPRAMENLIDWYGKNEDKLHPIELAA